jgi:hypothetical protein
MQKSIATIVLVFMLLAYGVFVDTLQVLHLVDKDFMPHPLFFLTYIILLVWLWRVIALRRYQSATLFWLIAITGILSPFIIITIQLVIRFW